MGSDSQSMPALPGFDAFLQRDVDRAGAMDMRSKEYNAIRIKKDYPGTYDSVARALFFYRLPVKTCADLFRMSSSCVAAIRDQVIAASSTNGAAAFLVNSRRQSQRDIVLARLTEAISEKLSDESTVADMSVADLTALLERLEKAPPARNGTERSNDDTSRTDVTIVDASSFDDVLNGLDSAKKSAAIPGPDSVVPAGSEDVGSADDCSTGDTDFVRGSFGMSNRNSITAKSCGDSACYDDVCDSLCDSLCSYADSDGSADLDRVGMVTPTPTSALIPPGAGGRPGPAAAPGSTNNALEENQ